MTIRPEDYKVDRSNFPPGPWDNEPDRVDWQCCGFHCMVIRNQMGTLCGYVGLPPGHRLYGHSIESADLNLDVDGGINYADRCGGHICHTPALDEPDNVWWLGFDCGHPFNFAPMLSDLWDRIKEPNLKGTYRNIAYVKEQVERLALQLK